MCNTYADAVSRFGIWETDSRRRKHNSCSLPFTLLFIRFPSVHSGELFIKIFIFGSLTRVTDYESKNNIVQSAMVIYFFIGRKRRKLHEL